MLDLILACAPNVAPATIQQIIMVESAGNPLAVNINTRNGVKLKPARKITTPEHAIAVTYEAIALGHTVDMGYMQFNSANLKSYGYTVRDIFHPCTNLKAGSTMLKIAYSEAVKIYGPGQKALLAALSKYNTGSFTKGFYNGYVARYVYLPKKPVMLAHTAETSVWR